MLQLSIIVTSYNVAPYIEQALDSVSAERRRDIEIIVVDDGSTDGTDAIIRRKADLDDRIKPVFLCENSIGGVATAANKGLELAQGDYIGFLDGDDFCHPEMYSLLLKAARAGDHDLAMCRYHLLDTQTGELSEPAEMGRWSELKEGSYVLDVNAKQKMLPFIAVPWRKIYKRQLLEDDQIRFPVVDYFFEDNPFHWYTILSAHSIALVDRSLCTHRVARAGQTMMAVDDKTLGIFSHHDTIRTWLEDREMFDDFRLNLIGWVVAQMEWVAPKTDGKYRTRLFEDLHRILSSYQLSDIEEAIRNAGKGERTLAMTKALCLGDETKFNTALMIASRRRTLFGEGVNHLRTFGPRRTMKVTASYLKARSQKLGLTIPFARRRRDEIEEIMFGLAVIQQQLNRIENRLNKLETQEAED